jgi:hypothetical protein
LHSAELKPGRTYLSIVIPNDLPASESQQFVEDCPVCCRPNIIHVEINESGGVQDWAEPE